MPPRAIVDSGPLIAFFDRDDQYQLQAHALLLTLPAPLLTCEAVVAESMHILRRLPIGQDALLAQLERGHIRIAFSLNSEIAAVRALRAKYADVPMSLADACIVRMAELFDDHAVCTLDADFRIYRKHGRQAIPLLNR